MKKTCLFWVALMCLIAPGFLFGQIHFTATLDGAQAGTTSTGSGSASLTLNETLTELRYVITFQGLSGNLSAAGGHFHYGLPGISGPVVKSVAVGLGNGSQTLVGSWKSTDGTAPLTRAAVESLLTGRVYLNFHTAANPGGEIRGQVNLATALHFTANLDGTQAGTSSTGTGTGVFVFDPSKSQVRFRVTYRGLTGPLSAAGGHLHTGAPGVSGGVVKTLAPGSNPANATVAGTWKSTDATQALTAALVDSLIAGKLYANFHTASSPAGEVRGQLVLNGGYGFLAEVEGNQENPPVVTNGTGTGSFLLNEARNEVKYDITWANLSSALSPAGGHIHLGQIGRNGAVMRAIAAGGDSASRTISGVWKASDSQPLTPALVESLFTGKLYMNLHTPANTGGEVRGQLDMTTGIGFTARIDGAQAGTASAGTGTGSIVLNAERKDLRFSITFFGLSGPLSAAGGHFHYGLPGTNGPVVKAIAAGNSSAAQTLTGDWSSSDVSQALTPASIDSLIAGKIYANFHTAASPAGEIRGQLHFGPDVVTGVEEVANGSVPAKFSLDQNYPNPFNPSTVIRFQLNEATRVSLKIYNVLGQEQASLINDVLQAGTYQTQFNAAGLPSGTYFYRLTASGGMVETRKMMLVK
jgi:hypothetical protein